jgi:hypothetical protein
MIESRSQTGQWRKMIPSQSSAQPVASLHSGTETGTKRIVPHRGSASGSDPTRSLPEAEPRLLKKTQLKENILLTYRLQGMNQEIGRLSPCYRHSRITANRTPNKSWS